MSTAQIDPELEYLLESAGADTPIDVALLLRSQADPQQLLDRLGLAAHSAVTSSFVERAGVLSVRAPAAIIRTLIAQPEVEMASAAASDEE